VLLVEVEIDAACVLSVVSGNRPLVAAAIATQHLAEYSIEK
jgi:hypothetical protein